jgi:hypothetical protein
MASDAKTRPAADYTCTCGAVHGVTMVTAAEPQSDSAECEWCGTTIRKWKDAVTWPIYVMKRTPDE